jgi:hypothetical protein
VLAELVLAYVQRLVTPGRERRGWFGRESQPGDAVAVP